jgi:hypothetical protein
MRSAVQHASHHRAYFASESRAARHIDHTGQRVEHMSVRDRLGHLSGGDRRGRNLSGAHWRWFDRRGLDGRDLRWRGLRWRGLDWRGFTDGGRALDGGGVFSGRRR